MENYLTQEEQKRIRITAILILAAATISVVAVNGTCQQKVNGQESLSLEPVPPPLPINGTEVTLTGDEMDRDININPDAFLPMNGTQTISTAGATDLDINVFPPEGVSVIIQNETITVTNHPVTIGSPTAAASTSTDSGGDEDEEG